MKRNFTLILLTVIVVLLLAVWIYIMISDRSAQPGPGNIDGSGEFTEFGNLIDPNDTGVPGDGTNTGSSTTSGSVYDPDILRQLTTRNVIGYEEITLASTTYIIYMESGVGHIYGIDLTTGEEERLSATTIPNARVADFSTDGELVVVKTGSHTGTNPITLAQVDYDTGVVALEPLAEAVETFIVTDENEIFYTAAQNSSVDVLSYSPESDTTRTVFSTLFREATVLLNKNGVGPHYFYPKYNLQLEGFVYEVNSAGRFTRLPLDGFGFTAYAWDDVIVTAETNRSGLMSTAYKDGVVERLPVVLPQKCTLGGETLYCAIPNTEVGARSFESWGRGTRTYTDNLAQIIEDEAQQLINITNHTGRNVDVINGSVASTSGDWYFQNKLDNTLWIYELSRLIEVNEDTL